MLPRPIAPRRTLLLSRSSVSLFERPGQERHQRAHFLGGPQPVLRRERVQRQSVDAELAGGAHDLADRVDAGLVSRDAGESAGGRPAAVSVHDDRDVAGDARRV